MLIGLGPDSRFLALEANSVYTHLGAFFLKKYLLRGQEDKALTSVDL
jgi:hypothetical protein